MDDFELSCRGLYRALTIREKYMRLAYQRFPCTASQYLRDIEGETFKTEDQVQPGEEGRRLGLQYIHSALFIFYYLKFLI